MALMDKGFWLFMLRWCSLKILLHQITDEDKL